MVCFDCFAFYSFLYVLLIKSFNDPKLLKFNFHYLIGAYLISIIFLITYKFFNSSISLYNQFDVLIFDFFDLRNFAVFNETETGLSNNPSINSTGFSRVVLILAVILIYYDLTKNSENCYFFQFHCSQKLYLSLVEFVVPLFLNQGSYGQPQSFLLDL